MYQVSDRSVRGYRQKLREGKSFHIHLKTKDGKVDIRVGEDSQAMMLNPDTIKYDLPLGDGPRIVDLIESNSPIPGLKVFWGAKDEIPEATAEESVPGYQVLAQKDEVLEEHVVPQPSSSRSPKGKKAATTRVASSAPLLVAAYKSGSRKFRKGWDSLYERADGVLVWDLAIRKQVDNHWQTTDTVTVALFTPNNGVVLPTNARQYDAVVARRALLTLNRSELEVK